MKKEAKDVLSKVFENSRQYLRYYTSFNGSTLISYQQECLTQMYIMSECIEVADMVDKAYADNMAQTQNTYLKIYQDKGGQLPY